MIKYFMPYKSYDNSDWLVTFDFKGYSGDPIELRGVGDSACTISYESPIDDVWEDPLIDTKAIFNVYNQGNIDTMELLALPDRECIVTVTRNGSIKFKGFLMVDGLQVAFQSAPYQISLTATSGLPYLEGIEYSVFGAEFGTRCPLNYFRRILMNQLDIDLPIRWCLSVEAVNEEIDDDAFQNIIWSNRGDGFIVNPTTGRFEYRNCEYIIEGMTKALQCRLFQADGAWWVVAVDRHATDILTYNECANTTGIPVITEKVIENKRVIGPDYKFIKGDSILTMIPAVNSVEVTYDHSQQENILPNGGMDLWNSGGLLYWGFDSSTGSIVDSHPSITERGGLSVDIWNITSDQKKMFKLFQPLPIDAHTLFNTFQWGFTFMAVAGHYPVDAEGFIDWSTRPLKASVKYTVTENNAIVDYFLNEFGYWQKEGESLEGSLRFDKIEYEVNLPLNIRNVRVYFSGNPGIGDEMTIRMRAINNNSGSMTNYTYIVDAGSENNLEVALNSLKNALPSRISSRSVHMNDSTHGYVYYQDFIPNGSPTANVVNYANSETFKYIHFSVDGLKPDYSANITFQGAGSLDNKFKDPGNIDLSTLDGSGLLSIEFILEPGQRIVLDDIWMKPNTNKDVYKATYSTLDNTKKKEITLNISSSFSGFMGSNFMQAYYTSDDDWKFIDFNGNEGSLTNLYARKVMEHMYKPSIIFNGSISTRDADWSYINNYEIQGLERKRFIPLNPQYNTETNEVFMVAMEFRNDTITYGMEHYGSDDEKLLKNN